MENFKRKNAKTNQKGITLIALVITIIVLLLLAGISISMLAGNNSVLNRASQGKSSNILGTAKDAVNLAVMAAVQDYYQSIYDGQNVSTTYTSAGLDEYITKNVGGNATNSEYNLSVVDVDFANYTAGEKNTTSWSKAGSGAEITLTYMPDSSFVVGTLNNGVMTWGSFNNAGQDPSATPGGMASTNIKDANNNIVDLATLDADSVGQYYGTEITVNNKKYGLFYVDYDGKYSNGVQGTIYLRAQISAGSIALSGTLAEADKADAISIMKQINPDWAKTTARGNVAYNDYTAAEKGATYLCNKNNSTWSGIKTDFENQYGASNVNYVIGAPSVEMFLASYNAKYSSLATKYTAHFKGAGEQYTYPGYLYSNNGGTTCTEYYSSAITNANGGIYKPSAYTWLASPLSNSIAAYVCRVGSSGHLDYITWGGSLAVCPLVSLKSGVNLLPTT